MDTNKQMALITLVISGDYRAVLFLSTDPPKQPLIHTFILSTPKPTDRPVLYLPLCE